jgi:hypothetical protein
LAATRLWRSVLGVFRVHEYAGGDLAYCRSTLHDGHTKLDVGVGHIGYGCGIPDIRRASVRRCRGCRRRHHLDRHHLRQGIDQYDAFRSCCVDEEHKGDHLSQAGNTSTNDQIGSPTGAGWSSRSRRLSRPVHTGAPDRPSDPATATAGDHNVNRDPRAESFGDRRG